MQQALPTRQDWEDLLTKEGNQGGMSASVCTWEDMRTEHIDIANATPLPPADLNHTQQAKDEVTDLTNYVIYATKRKAVPRDSLPTEILVALLAPNYIRKKLNQHYTHHKTHSSRLSPMRARPLTRPIHTHDPSALWQVLPFPLQKVVLTITTPNIHLPK